MLRRLPALLCLSVSALSPCPLPAHATSQDRPPEPPLAADGFEVQAILDPALAFDPQLMAWGENAELWLAGRVVGSVQETPYSIVRAADSDGDGRMDQVHAYHQLAQPASAMLVLHDGLLVASAAQILWLRDTNGDRVADQVRVLYSGLGSGDAAHGIRDFTWGLDGWIWAVQGTNGARSRHVSSPYRDRSDAHSGQAALTNFGELPPGLVRLRSDGSAIEPIAVISTGVGGLTISRRAEVFFSRPGSSSLAHLLLSEEALGAQRAPGARTWQALDRERRTSARDVADVVLYQGGAWPEAYDGAAFVCLPQAGRVEHDDLTRTADSFRATRANSPLLRSAQAPFAPQQICNGPGGALYVLDREADQGTNGKLAPRPGRIWRVQRSDALAQPAASLEHALAADRSAIASGAESAGYIDNASPESTIRTLWRAWRAMKTPGDGVRVGMALEIALSHTNSAVRRNAARVAAHLAHDPNAHGLLAYLVRSIADRDPRVRLAGLRALREFELDAPSLSRLLQQARALSDSEALSLLLGIAHRAPLKFFAEILTEVAKAPQDPIDPVLVVLLESLASDPRLGAAANAASELHASVRALHATGPGARCALHGVLLLWDPPLAAQSSAALLEIAGDDALPAPLRLAALHALLRDPPQAARAAQFAAQLLRPMQTAGVQRAVLRELIETSAAGSGKVLSHSLMRLTPALRLQLAELLARNTPRTAEHVLCFEQWAIQLEQRELHAADFPPALRDVLHGVNDAQLAGRLHELLRPATTDATDAWIADNAQALGEAPDARNGARVFHVNCAPCHREPGANGLPIGPDVADFERLSRAGLLQRILQPQRSIDSEYLEYIVTPVVGREVHGRISHEDDTSITLTGIAGVRRLPRGDLLELRSSGKSPMPSGFEALGARALRDLLEHLLEGN